MTASRPPTNTATTTATATDNTDVELTELPTDVRAALAVPLRLRRARDTEPPLAAGPPFAPADLTPALLNQGTLALSFPLPNGRPAEVDSGRELRLASYRSRYALELDERDEPTPRVELPDPRPWCVRLVQAALEATIGDRPVAQLLRWTSREVYESISKRAAPTLAGSAVGRRRSTRPVVRSVHLNEPSDGVVEGCATVHDGTRSRAVAIRLEGLGGRWVCTALEVV